MIHVDVKQAQPDDWRRGFNVEVSVDGGPFVNHWYLSAHGARGTSETDARLSAKSDGRIYAAGIKFGGGDVRMTAFGDNVYIPDMSTIVPPSRLDFGHISDDQSPEAIAEQVEAVYRVADEPTGDGS